jgi:hypothetical protein
MNAQLENLSKLQIPPAPKASRPTESGSFSVELHVKIHDPNTKQVYVEKRA